MLSEEEAERSESGLQAIGTFMDTLLTINAAQRARAQGAAAADTPAQVVSLDSAACPGIDTCCEHQLEEGQNAGSSSWVRLALADGGSSQSQHCSVRRSALMVHFISFQ